MNDPHVNALFYRVIAADDVDYDKAPPLSGETDDFVVTITSDAAEFRMKSHFATEEEAKKIVDQFLQTWSIFMGVQEYSPDEITFRFKNAEIVDRSPPTKDTQSKFLSVCLSETIHVSMTVSTHLSRATFPSLPEKFVASPDVETMYLRYKMYRQNREALLSMAYWFLTNIEASGGGTRKIAAEKYYIDLDVLRKIGQLTSTRGSKLEARKAPKKTSCTPLTQNEKVWLEKVIKRITFRLGECAFDPQRKLQTITMNDFPSLI